MDVFECQRCKNTKEADLAICYKCNGRAINPFIRDSAPDLPTIVIHKYSSSRSEIICSNCVSSIVCQRCNLPPEKHRLEDMIKQNQTSFLHDKCAEQQGKMIEKREKEERGLWCFIATSVYGTASAPEVILLRNFRDQVLTRYILGRWFTDIYYKVSPPLASFIENKAMVKNIVRRLVLDPLVRFLSRRFPV